MANQYFQFKQFTIHQDKTAMKVCTDACLFGAWVAGKLFHNKNPADFKRILDIGSGTGLLSLMLAQKSTADIDTIEIETSAYEQAKENISASPWHNRVHAMHADIRTFAKVYLADEKEKYDLIISNPPFYESQLKSNQQQKDMAMHDSSLTIEALLSAVSTLLSFNGCFALLLPFYRKNECLEKAMTFGLKLKKELLVRQSPKHDYFRVMMVLEKSATDLTVETEELTIKEIHHSYSLPFVNYLQDYYLSL